jgi:hypothetical protein
MLFDQPTIRKKLLLKQPHITSSFGSIAGGGGGGVDHKVSSLPTVQTESVLGLGRAAAAVASVNNLGSSSIGSCKKFGSAVVGARCFATTIMAEPNKEKIKEILASNLDPTEKLRLIVEEQRLVDKENVREAVTMLNPEEREELDRRARAGEVVVPGGTGGKSLEAQIHLAEGAD